MTFLVESWFWRGTQSAIFYYLSCTPCVDARYRKKRRREALRAEKVRPEVVTTQPGIVPQPGPFETNEAWAEEMVEGPGPPKGWKKDKLLQKIKQNIREEKAKQTAHDNTLQQMAAIVPAQAATVHSKIDNIQQFDFARAGPSRRSEHNAIPPDENGPVSDSSSISSDSSSPSTKRQRSNSRPRAERKISNTFDTIRGTLRSSLHPDKWNRKRYEREDEVLRGFNFNEKINKMWDRAKGHGASHEKEHSDPQSQRSGRKRASTNDSDRTYDYGRARNPEINELHPPVVSQLPATRDEVAWMILPPPSRAVMEGKIPPDSNKNMRWPLALIGTTMDEEQHRKEREALRGTMSDAALSKKSSRMTDRPPPLSLSPYAASDASVDSLETHKSSVIIHKENDRRARPRSLPLQYELTKATPAAQLVFHKRGSSQDLSERHSIAPVDGIRSPSETWNNYFTDQWAA